MAGRRTYDRKADKTGKRGDEESKGGSSTSESSFGEGDGAGGSAATRGAKSHAKRRSARATPRDEEIEAEDEDGDEGAVDDEEAQVLKRLQEIRQRKRREQQRKQTRTPHGAAASGTRGKCRANFGKTRSRRPNTGVSVFSPSMRHLRGTRVAISGTRVRNPHFLLFHAFWQVFMKKHTSPRASGADPPQTMVMIERIAHSTPQVRMLSYSPPHTGDERP